MDEVYGALAREDLTLLRIGLDDPWTTPRPSSVSDEFAAICELYQIPVRPPGCFTPSSGDIPVMYCATTPLDAFVQGFCCLGPSLRSVELDPGCRGTLCISRLSHYGLGTVTTSALVLDYSKFAASSGVAALPTQDVGGRITEALHDLDELAVVRFESRFGNLHSTIGVSRPGLLQGTSTTLTEADEYLLEALDLLRIDLRDC